MNDILEERVDFKEVADNTFKEVLTEEALEFLSSLHKKFNKKRKELLKERDLVQKRFDKGAFPNFPNETITIRESDWVAAPLPKDLLDRRVEITGSTDRKMVINALNSGAKIFMADFEDSNAPTWDNLMEGQKNLRDAVQKTITFENKLKSKTYQLNEDVATLLVRPRGLHLNEKHLLIKGEELSGSLVDFGLYFFHNAKQLIANGSGPYFYLPKLEHYEEARWWNAVFVFAQDYLDIPKQTIKATVLIETITASFQIDEIIYELKDHMAGLNCGRWDYIFSYIKKFRNHKNFLVPDRDQVTMATPFMEAYSLRVIQRCHKRGVHAMGGMAAQIPIKNDEEANKVAFDKILKDKKREVKNGHDGTWVAHPGLVSIAMEVFNEHMPTKNQIHIKRAELYITEDQLVEMPKGTITEGGIRKNINVGILYLESWLSGVGAAALYNLMEDAATAEISRTQLWQWLHKEVQLDTGSVFNIEMYVNLQNEELEKIKKMVGNDRFVNGKFDLAVQLFDELVLSEAYQEFLTLEAYNYL
ncbi:MAG: malate synthase A [Flavobacteriaceae bacterium]|nr:malate synthase A [Flavobacteriaceae bacterium]